MTPPPKQSSTITTGTGTTKRKQTMGGKAKRKTHQSSSSEDHGFFNKQDLMDCFASSEFARHVVAAVDPHLDRFVLQINKNSSQISKHEKEIQVLKRSLNEQAEKLAKLELKVSVKERNEKLSILRFTGLPEGELEASKKLVDLCKNELDVPLNENDFLLQKPRAQSTSSNRNKAPLHIVKFFNMWTRRAIYKNRTKLKGTNVFISEPLTKTTTSSFLPLPHVVPGSRAEIYLDLRIDHLCSLLGRHSACDKGGRGPEGTVIGTELWQKHTVHNSAIIYVGRRWRIISRLSEWQHRHTKSGRSARGTQTASTTSTTTRENRQSATSTTTRGNRQSGRPDEWHIMSEHSQSFKCNICQKRVLKHSYHMECSLCKRMCHLKCLQRINKDDEIYTKRHENLFYCTTCMCLKETFAFNQLDDTCFNEAISQLGEKHTAVTFEILQNQELIFSPFDFNDSTDSPLNDVDPDIQFYSERFSETLHSCNYYLSNLVNEEINKKRINDNCFSLLHSNIRSAQKNLGSLEHFLSTLHHEFSIIGISESWLKDHNVDRYGIQGYQAVHRYRPTRCGGGVSIFVQDSIDYFQRPDLCYQNKSIESVFIEIDKDQVGKDRNVIVGVICRPPDTDINTFNDYLSELLSKVKIERKFIACLGDFNISLLNIESHGPTQDFADVMYSNALLPCITKPTRVTSKTASLIDNIFCNGDIDDHRIFTGLLYTDISDHFPIFYIDHDTKAKQNETFFTKRIYSQKNLERFTTALCNKDWSATLSSEDPQRAYTMFTDKFTEVYEKCFPLKSYKFGYKTRKPWLTEGLKNSIDRKNKLYFRKQKTHNPEHERIYKKYRNKLNKLIHLAEQHYYEARLEENKNNLKRSWLILKEILNKRPVGLSSFVNCPPVVASFLTQRQLSINAGWQHMGRVPHPNYVDPECYVATVCHHVRFMYWEHLGHFQRAISHLKWHKIVCMRYLACAFSQMKSTDMFSMYLQSGVPRHFIWWFIAGWT